ncbi:hypothetical protein AB3N60_05990 [Leptospira sp. WS39.C2]
MDKYSFLLIIILFGYLIAPYFTNHFFLNNSKSYKCVHLACIFFVLVSIILKIPKFSFVWIIFCGYGFYHYLYLNQCKLFKDKVWLGTFPFIFSLVSAIWFVSGINDFRLLGYDSTWSFYAAIHGCFIGWLLLSGIIFLTMKNRYNIFFIVMICSIIVFFLLIALGIYQFSYLKKIGVIGYYFLLPFVLFIIAKKLNPKRRIHQFYLVISFVSLCLTLSLAVFKEFFQPTVMFSEIHFVMIYIHGGFNAFFVIPLLLFVIKKETIHSS